MNSCTIVESARCPKYCQFHETQNKHKIDIYWFAKRHQTYKHSVTMKLTMIITMTFIFLHMRYELLLSL